MNTPVNHVHLVGSLTKAPEVKTKKNGEKWAVFAISTKEYRQNSEGKIEKENHWHKLVAKNKWAHILEEFAEKGQQIAIEGKLRSRFFKSANGKQYLNTEIEVKDLVLMDRVVSQIA